MTFVGIVFIILAYSYLADQYVGTSRRLELEKYRANLLQLCDAFESGSGEVRCFEDGVVEANAITLKITLSLLDESNSLLLRQDMMWQMPMVYAYIPVSGYLNVGLSTSIPFARPGEHSFDRVELSQDSSVTMIGYPKPTMNITSSYDGSCTMGSLTILLPRYSLHSYGMTEESSSIVFARGSTFSISSVGTRPYPDMVWVGYKLEVQVTLEVRGQIYEWQGLLGGEGSRSIFMIRFIVQEFDITVLG